MVQFGVLGKGYTWLQLIILHTIQYIFCKKSDIFIWRGEKCIQGSKLEARGCTLLLWTEILHIQHSMFFSVQQAEQCHDDDDAKLICWFGYAHIKTNVIMIYRRAKTGCIGGCHLFVNIECFCYVYFSIGLYIRMFGFSLIFTQVDVLYGVLNILIYVWAFHLDFYIYCFLLHSSRTSMYIFGLVLHFDLFHFIIYIPSLHQKIRGMPLGCVTGCRQ